MSLWQKFGLAATQPQTANVPNYKMSPLPSRGGIIYDTTLTVNNLDGSVGEVITSIRVGLGGDLVVQGPAGDVFYYPGLLDGQTIYGKFIAVLSSANMNSNGTATTTPGSTPSVAVANSCDRITWYGGES